MKASKFATGLTSYSDALDHGQRAAVQELAELLACHGTKTVDAICKKAVAMDGGPTMSGKQPTVSEAYDAVVVLEKTLRNIATKSVADDAQRLLNMMAQHRDWSMSDFVAQLNTALTQKAKSKAKAKSKTVSATDRDIVKHYVNLLEDTNANRTAFKETLSKLRSDKRVRTKQELQEITNQFYGVDLTYRTKKDAIDTITRRHNQDQRVWQEDQSFSGVKS